MTTRERRKNRFSKKQQHTFMTHLSFLILLPLLLLLASAPFVQAFLCPPNSFFINYHGDGCYPSLTSRGLAVIIGVPVGLILLCVVACVICVISSRSSSSRTERTYVIAGAPVNGPTPAYQPNQAGTGYSTF